MKNPSSGADGLPAMAATKTMTGQCQRYREYEMRPKYCAGEVSSRETGEKTPPVPRPTRTSAAPMVGSNAAYPGKAVPAENRNADNRMQTMPATPATGFQRSGRRDHSGTVSASKPPKANSQARVKVEK